MHRTQSIIQEFSQGDYTINNYPRRFDLKFVHHWLAKAACSSAVIPERLLERTIKNSFFWGVNHTSGAQVGFGRVQKDYATFAWVTDVFIIDEHRGRGLAAFLMEKMMAHPNMHATGRWLLGADQIHGLYRKFGFTNLENPKKIPQPAPRQYGSERPKSGHVGRFLARPGYCTVQSRIIGESNALHDEPESLSGW